MNTITPWPHRWAIGSGVAGIAAALFLLGMVTLQPLGVHLGPVTFGGVNDVLTVVQFALLPPVVLALARRLPRSGVVTVTAWLGAAAAVGCAALAVLLIVRVMTFAQQVVPQVLTIMVITGWLLTLGLVAHRTRALPRWFSLGALLDAAGLLFGFVFVAAGFVLPARIGLIVQIPGYVAGGLAWVALPVLVLLSARLLDSRVGVVAAAGVA